MPHPPALARSPRKHRRFPATMRVSLGAVVGVGLLVPSVLAAVEALPRGFDIPAGDASVTLKQYATQSGEQLLYSPDDVNGVKTQAVRGQLTPFVALEQMLEGTALKARQDGRTKAIAITAVPTRAAPPAASAASTSTPPSPNSSAQSPMSMKRKNPIGILAGWLALALAPSQSLYAATDGATGTIEGRAFNATTGEYLERARVTIAAIQRETFTDATGFYRLTQIPTGPTNIQLFYTGQDPVVETATITAGGVTQRDFVLGSPPGPGGGGIVTLSKFVVGASREMAAASLAINEQRFAPNIKSVVSTDEFGFIAEGNVAEFLKFVPGVSIDYTGGNARSVSINGVPSENVPITVGGFSLASPGNSGTVRAVELDMFSINNVSRIEIISSPTPESQGSALAGSVNLVPRSAFERARPSYSLSAYLMMRDNARDFHHSPGVRGPSRKVKPGFDVSAIVPVNKRFGFTASAGRSEQYTAGAVANLAWRGVNTPTNGNAFPHTTPDQPYLSQFIVRNNPKFTTRSSAGLTVDYKLSDRDRVSASFTYSTFDVEQTFRILTFNVNRVLPGQFSTTSTHGAAGAGNLQLVTNEYNRSNRTYMPTLQWRHEGPVWQAEAGLGYSHGRNRNGSDGFFTAATAQRSGVTVAFDDIFYLRPRSISVTDGVTGAAVNPYDLGTYTLISTASDQNIGSDLQRSAYASIKREFYGRVPLALKVGLDVRESARDTRGGPLPYNYIGADGSPNTADDSARPFLDEDLERKPFPFGFPQVQTMSTQAIWKRFGENPTHFTPNLNSLYLAEIGRSKHAEELISSAYVRGDLKFYEGRVKLVGGLRGEQTNIQAAGPLTDPTRNILRDQQGRPILGPNGQPRPLVTDPLVASRLTMIDRGSRAEKEYLRLFPSINVSWNIRENLIARTAYYQSVGRPNYNQYAGGIELPNTENPPAPNNRITVNNVGIKAWSAETVNVRLEYYLESVGQIAIGGFQRDFENFFGATIFNPTPEFFTLYGLDSGVYDSYEVETQTNLSDSVRMTGFDVSYRQALTFLPRWARGVQVFANGSVIRATGPAASNFAGYVPRTGNLGISLTRERYNARVNLNYRGRSRQAMVANGPSIEPGTFTWISKRVYIDVSGEWNITRNLALFCNLRNVGDTPDDQQIFGPSTPPHAQFRTRVEYGSLWTMGLKASF